MAGRTFTRNRIRGISFHHNRSAVYRTHRNGQSIHNNWAGPKTDEIRNSTPTPLTHGDIQRLLHDHSRAEIHTLVTQSIENLVSLQQLGQSLRKLSSSKEINRHSFELDELEGKEVHPLQLTALEVVSLQRIWKLRLELFEMIVMAQNSLRNFPQATSKTTQLQAAKSDRSRK